MNDFLFDFWNTGSHNTGSRNTGDWNTGSCNTGDRNDVSVDFSPGVSPTLHGIGCGGNTEPKIIT